MCRFILIITCLWTATVLAAKTNDPFPAPIVSDRDVIVVKVVEFAKIPAIDGQAARMMTMLQEAGTGRLFLSDQRGLLYHVTDDGAVSRYLDANDERWGVAVAAPWREMGVQSFAFHPQFGVKDSAGYGKFYTWSDTPRTPQPDFTTAGSNPTHDTVLWEWTAPDANASAYAGAGPREVVRLEQPFANHNGGGIAFNPLATEGDPDFGMLYIGNGDGGSGGDPLGLAQDTGSAFGKILRIDPLGRNSSNGQYGIPSDNPFAAGQKSATLPELYAYGLRNPQQLVWDAKTGELLVSDIGQNTVEEVSVVTSGGNLGWKDWEGSFRFVDRSGVDTDKP
ncbi:MAG: PQQ-dependent sugar dehydrogenase, partial [Pseudomonadales bacterium]